MSSMRKVIAGVPAALALGAMLACGGAGESFFTVSGRTATGDVTRPTVVGTTPGSGQTNVPRNTLIIVTFSEPVDAASVTGTSFEVQGAVGTITVTGASVTLQPSAPLPPRTTITATVSGIRDRNGNTMAAPYAWSFTTGS